MIPGLPRILTCPFCGKEKEIMTLISGNTCHMIQWSDNKRIAPMLPEISYVQKCPNCGKYYIIERQEVKYAREGHSFERGLLTYPEMKEAFAQLSEEGFLYEKEEPRLRMMLHHAFNDYYYRSEDNREISDEDETLFHENGIWLINNHITDNVMKSEFYREIGEFETALGILESVQVENEFLKRIVSKIRERIENRDRKVFKIQ